jgi:hypothetical protein
MRRQRASAAAVASTIQVVAAAALAACSSGGGEPVPDAATNAVCSAATVAAVTECAEMLEEGMAECTELQQPSRIQRIRLCGDLWALGVSDSHTSRECYYDDASRQLVGAWLGTDTLELCGGTSSHVRAGRVPAEIPCLPRRDPFCPPSPDAGTD